MAATPLPSSTVILLRDAPAGPDPFTILMVKRHGSVTFPGVHAFPGGVVDPHDAHAPGARLPATQRWATAGEGDCADDALPFWIAGAREVLEEVGVVLAHDAERRPPAVHALDHAALRARLTGTTSFADVLAPHGLVPATDGLFYFARWITPPRNPRRFDTRFLVGRMPAAQEAIVDGTETESCEWVSPRVALDRFVAADIDLIPPTVRTLDDLARFPSIDAVLHDASRRVIRPYSPDIDSVGGEPSMTYPDTSAAAVVPPRRLVLRAGRWRPADD